jgi:plasmid stability protein
MAQLVVRQIEDSTVQKLRERAAKAGVSMEEEHRRILRAAIHGARAAKSFKEHLLSIPPGGDRDLFQRKRTTSRRKLAL